MRTYFFQWKTVLLKARDSNRTLNRKSRSPTGPTQLLYFSSATIYLCIKYPFVCTHINYLFTYLQCYFRQRSHTNTSAYWINRLNYLPTGISYQLPTRFLSVYLSDITIYPLPNSFIRKIAWYKCR